MSHVFGKNGQEDRLHCIEKGIFLCEPGNPWSEDKGEKCYHPFAREEGWIDDIATWTIHCPVCGHHWPVNDPYGETTR